MSDLVFILAEAAAGPKPNPLIAYGPIILIVVMIFFLFRSQKKEKNRRQQMLDAVKTGDKVVTVGGIYAEITAVKEKTFTVKIADNVKVEVSKQAINSVVNQENQEKDYDNK